MSGRKTITYINFLQGIPAPIVALGGMIKVFLFYPLLCVYNIKDSIVKGGEASPTLDKLEIYHDGPQTVLDSSHVDLFPILLRC